MENNISPVVFMLAGAGLSQRAACKFTARKREYSGATYINMLI